MAGDAVTIARRLVGVRFRLHGRDPAHGLDCVGLAALAHGCAAVPTGYPLRGGDPESFAATIRALGFVRRRATLRAGDLLLLRPGPMQLHLGLWTGTTLIHADAGIGRVVETPGGPCWPVLSAWARRRTR